MTRTKYCYYYATVDGIGWLESSSEDWSIECLSLGGTSLERIGERFIDGSRVAVFEATSGAYYAATLVSLGEETCKVPGCNHAS